MTINQLKERGWVFNVDYAQKEAFGAILVVPYDRSDSPAKVSRTVTPVETALATTLEHAGKFNQLKGILS